MSEQHQLKNATLSVNPLFRQSRCPHPARNGSYEEYARPDGSSFCRACGEELDPPGTNIIGGGCRLVSVSGIFAALK